MRSDLITVSRMKDFNACRRRHHVKYQLGYRSATTAPALQFGTLVHCGLEAWWKAKLNADRLEAAQKAVDVEAAKADEVDVITMAKVKVMLAGYHARWASTMDDFEVLAVEAEFCAPLRNPVTGYPCRDLEVAGKIDVIVRRRDDGRTLFVEHKTSSEDLTTGSVYWQRLRMDPQVSAYHEGGKALGHKFDGCIYDVLAKFREMPKKATPVESRKYTKEGRLYANQRDKDETIEEFTMRIAGSMAENPEAYFGRAEVVRTEAELEESMRDIHATALMIRDCERLDRSPRNPDACHMPGRPCFLFDVCCGCASLDDTTKFRKVDQLHPELSNANQ